MSLSPEGRHILCIVPINTIQNWLAEFNHWLPTSADQSSLSDTGTVEPRRFHVHALNDSLKNLEQRTKVGWWWIELGKRSFEPTLANFGLLQSIRLSLIGGGLVVYCSWVTSCIDNLRAKSREKRERRRTKAPNVSIWKRRIRLNPCWMVS